MKLAVADYEESCTFDPSEPPRTPSPALQAQAHFTNSLHTTAHRSAACAALRKKRERKKLHRPKCLLEQRLPIVCLALLPVPSFTLSDLGQCSGTRLMAAPVHPPSSPNPPPPPLPVHFVVQHSHKTMRSILFCKINSKWSMILLLKTSCCSPICSISVSVPHQYFSV